MESTRPYTTITIFIRHALSAPQAVFEAWPCQLVGGRDNRENQWSTQHFITSVKSGASGGSPRLIYVPIQTKHHMNAIQTVAIKKFFSGTIWYFLTINMHFEKKDEMASNPRYPRTTYKATRRLKRASTRLQSSLFTCLYYEHYDAKYKLQRFTFAWLWKTRAVNYIIIIKLQDHGHMYSSDFV